MRQELVKTSFGDLQNLVAKGYGNITSPLAAKILELINTIQLPVTPDQLTGHVSVELVARNTIEVELNLKYRRGWVETHGAAGQLLKRPRNRSEELEFEKTERFELAMFPLNPHQAVYLGLCNNWGQYYHTRWALAEDLVELTKAPAGLFGSFFEAGQSA